MKQSFSYHFTEKEITKILVREINAKLETSIDADNDSITLFTNAPNGFLYDVTLAVHDKE